MDSSNLYNLLIQFKINRKHAIDIEINLNNISKPIHNLVIRVYKWTDNKIYK